MKKPNKIRPQHRDDSVSEHQHPKFIRVTTSMLFHDGAQANWTVVPHQTDQYEVEIVQVPTENPDKPKRYSLLTLGIQSIQPGNTNEIEVKETKEAKETVHIYPGEVKEGVVLKGPMDIQPTGLHLVAGDLDQAGIWFISFTGNRCVLKVTAKNRPRLPGTTYWYPDSPSDRKGHDNTIPHAFPPL